MHRIETNLQASGKNPALLVLRPYYAASSELK